MSEYTIVKYCAPTLAGLKTGNLFVISYENEGKGFKKCGCWKVYGDVSEAEKMFRIFEKCTCVYMDCLARGKTFEELIVVNN